MARSIYRPMVSILLRILHVHRDEMNDLSRCFKGGVGLASLSVAYGIGHRVTTSSVGYRLNGKNLDVGERIASVVTEYRSLFDRCACWDKRKPLWVGLHGLNNTWMCAYVQKLNIACCNDG